MLEKLYLGVAPALTKSDAQNEKVPNSRITGWDTVRFVVTDSEICGMHFEKCSSAVINVFFSRPTMCPDLR